MAATVSPQFLFVGEADAPVVTAFRINSDGSLAPVPGSPFAIKAPAQALAAAHDILLVTTETGITAFHVEKETGFLQQTDLAGIPMTARDTPSVAGTGPQLAVLDSGERFMFVVNANQAELLQYRVERGKPLSPPIAAIPIPHSATSITVVKP
ncbi:MAG TPA: hypothetical protein VFR84_12260 [Candidatus Angelobacter sp.]|nr:hypothetical protein [Candidatus Angelobacter sp.]